MAASVRLTAGTIFAGDYTVKKPLFEADDRAVYVAEQKSTGRELALKVLSPDLLPDDAARARFLEEAKIGGKVSTVHVLDVRSVGVDSETGLPWMASELLEGENLEQRAGRESKFPMREWDELLSQVLHGLAAVHAVGVHHGALNGESIFLAKPSEVNESFRVELLDFGVPQSARMKALSKASRLAWAAPEQLKEGPQSPATDVWAVGHLAFRVLTGKNYFKAASGGDVAALEAEIKAGASEPASARARGLGFTEALPKTFDAWFARCTKVDPAQRFASAHDALEGAADLLTEASGVMAEEIQNDEGPRKKPPPLPPMVRVITENPKPAIAIVALLIVAALGGGFGLGLLRGTKAKQGPAASRTAAITWSKGSVDDARKACDGGDPAACHGLGQMHQYGLKMPKDEAMAGQFFSLACDKGDAPACASMALLSLSGEGVRRQPARAVEFYQRACDMSDAVSCADLADLYATGNGVAASESTAAALRAKACQGGMTEVCK